MRAQLPSDGSCTASRLNAPRDMGLCQVSENFPQAPDVARAQVWTGELGFKVERGQPGTGGGGGENGGGGGGGGGIIVLSQ